MTSAVSGRYSNTVSMDYDSIGRMNSESLAIGGQTYVTGYERDARNQINKIAYPSGRESTVSKIKPNGFEQSSADIGTATLDSEDVNPNPPSFGRSRDQIPICHEFGHLLGLDHPNLGAPDEYTTPSGNPTSVGSSDDDIMGSGMSVQERHLAVWAQELNRRYPGCGPFTSNPTTEVDNLYR